MRVRRVHRLVGLVMLLPLVGWAITGAIFFIKPGYGGAYEVLSIRTYPLGVVSPVANDPAWLETRRLRTVLGPHLLARTTAGWRQIAAPTGTPVAAPEEARVRVLLEDAFTANRERYGQIVAVEELTATTNTGVRVTLDWDRLTLSQRGPDTDRIDAIYRIHYLQWSGIAVVDRVLGAIGLLLLGLLSALGVRLAFGR